MCDVAFGLFVMACLAEVGRQYETGCRVGFRFMTSLQRSAEQERTEKTVVYGQLSESGKASELRLTA